MATYRPTETATANSGKSTLDMAIDEIFADVGGGFRWQTQAKGAILVREMDTEHLVHAINYVLRNPKLRIVYDADRKIVGERPSKWWALTFKEELNRRGISVTETNGQVSIAKS